VHFYLISAAQRDAITPTDPAFQAQDTAVPNPAFVPAGYVPTPDVFERMGVHWVDLGSPEFTPAGFSRTFIYGFWNGQMNFLEPMLTTAFVESVKTLPGQSVMVDIPQAAAVERDGVYPTRYGVRYDAAAQAYDIVLEGLTARSATALQPRISSCSLTTLCFFVSQYVHITMHCHHWRRSWWTGGRQVPEAAGLHARRLRPE
jgi:hypothetical protein